MVWIKATYEFASFFSYRIPDFSSQYAVSSIFPGLSTIKLAIVSAAIENSGSVEYGKKIFEIVKNSALKIEPPKKIVQISTLIKRLKRKKNEIGLETTFGIRGYTHYSGKFGIYLNVPAKDVKKIEEALRNIRYFGTSDSLVSCIGITRSKPSLKVITPIETFKNNLKKNILLIPTKDIDSQAKFDDINIYNKSKKKGKIFIRKFYAIKSFDCHKGKGWTVYEFH